MDRPRARPVFSERDMRTLPTVTLLSAAWLAACDAPSPTAVSAPPPSSLIFIGGWQRGNLPFTPVAINDSGVIVGNVNNTAVRYFNGTVTVLAPPTGLTGAYTAVDIAKNGHILGVINGSILIWTSPLVAPQVVVAAAALQPSSMNDGHMVVGTTSGHGFRWTPSVGLVNLANPFSYGAPATHVSRNGYVAGFAQPLLSGPPEVLVRWDPSGTPTIHQPVGQGSPPENRPSDMDDFGNILSTSGGTTIDWTVGGTVYTISGVPQPTRTTGWSPLGRIVGHTIGSSNRPWTLFQGALTWLPQPSPADQADIPVGVNACGSVVARRVNGGVVLDSGYVWRKPLTCDNAGVVLP